MSDDLRIPMMGAGLRTPAREPIASGYNSGFRARRPGQDQGMRWAIMGAAGLGGLLLVGMGGYALMGRRPAVIPVIEADIRPIRIKPENAGGMQVAGADEISGDGVTGNEKMAPAAESPAPQALRAQMQQAPAAAPATEAPPTAAAAPAPAPAPASAPAAPSPAPGASPLPDTPARPGVGAKAGTAPPAPRPATATAAGALQVQLAALGSEAAAQAEWKRLAKAMPDVLAGLLPVIQKTERDGKTFWRLRTGGFADTADATAFCGKLRAKGGACAIASF